jgi:cytochrome oxidase assembly protein ShyY1
MYGFLLRPRWIGFHLLVVAGVVLMVNLGFWQLRRLDERREFNAAVEARIDQPVVPLDELLAQLDAGTDVDDIEWRPVEVRGTYLPEEQVLVVNRSQNGRAGDNVVTPLALDDGRVLVVNRGFVPLAVDVPDAPAGEVTVRGVVRPSQERRRGQLSDPSDGELTEVQRIDLDRLAQQLPGDVVAVYVDLLASDPAEADGVPEPVTRPDLSEGPHLSYAVQWFIFSAAVVVGWVLAVRWSVGKRRAERSTGRGAAVTDTAGAPADGDRRPSSDDEPATARP